MTRIPESELILNADGSIYHLNLRPRHLCDTIIVVGDPGRVHLVSSYFDDISFEMNKREFITHTGTYRNKRLMVISSGMGVDNVEILMTELDALANIDFKTRQPKKNLKQLQIIRIGTSGSIQEDIRVGSHVISETAIGWDNLISFYHCHLTPEEEKMSNELGEELLLPFRPYCLSGDTYLIEMLGKQMIKGNTITAPGFYAPQGRQLRVHLKQKNLLNRAMHFHRGNFWLTNFEMESAMYYAMGRIFGHRVVSTNAIIANRVRQTFSKNPTKVVNGLIKKVLDGLVAMD